jgi:serine/threonine protein kinase
MKVFNPEELKQFIDGNEILYGSTEHPGIMLSPTGEIIKSFFKRKKISTSTFFPQAEQFKKNSQRLFERGIKGPIVTDIIYCKEIPVHMVVYNRLEGDDLRVLAEREGVNVLSQLPSYLAELHEIGVFFRAIHLGNILLHAREMSLIDISDLSIQSSPLGNFQRARNLAHLFNSDLDKNLFTQYGLQQFLKEYLLASGLAGRDEWLFMKRLEMAIDKDMRDVA